MGRQSWLIGCGVTCVAIMFLVTMRVNVYDAGVADAGVGDIAAAPTQTPIPAVTITPTAKPDDTPAPTLMPTATPTPRVVNGLPVDTLLLMPPDVQTHIREIYQRGLDAGNDPGAFAKIGDSNSTIPFFLAPFDDPDGYKLGEYAYLQPTIDNFVGSFERDSVAVRVGNHTWSVLDSLWADPDRCQPNE